jgi:antitoxin component YwqK of YwqJK toxin-antitoxin module
MMKKSLFFFAGLIVLLAVLNHILQTKLNVLLRDRPRLSPAVSSQGINVERANPQKASSYRRHNQSVTRRDRLSPGRDYTESVFYLEDAEIARQKTAGGRVVETTGKIPDGKVKFVDESGNKHGVEHYRDGKKDGPSNTYYPDGQAFEEAYYRHGKLLWRKEYYKDGSLRLEIDYQDARDDGDDVETGRGRLYYQDGTVKYEWQLTNRDEEGFKRSYDQKGGLRGALYFDRDGRLME